MQDVLERLKEGVRKFRSEVYEGREEQYRTAATTPQQPHTLIITCADSRIDVETVTSCGPGELFIARNIGNMVPPYGEMLGGVSAVIEYAVDVVKVKHAAIMGHTDCGAMKGLLNPESTKTLPTVVHWLQNGTTALRVAETIDEKRGIDLLPTVTEQNVLLQMQHLKTHPSVAAAMARGELTVSGWIYDIGHGDVRIFDDAQNRFVPVNAE
ncbi:MAG: carbonic anhydrase [Acidobacteria bacterium]|nr:carbonic anhydrase [Acidobacteriota bacterium]